MKPKIVFFVGPPKTATSSLYETFKRIEGVKVQGGKENYDYQKKNFQNKLLKRSNKAIKPIIFFDHDILINKHLFNYQKFFENNKILVVLCLRDPFERSVSAVGQIIKTGDLNLKHIKKNSEIVFQKFPKVYINSNLISLTEGIFDTSINFRVLLFDDFKSDPKKCINKILKIIGIKNIKEYESIIKINASKKYSYPKIVKLIRKYLRPLLVNLNSGKIWTLFKNFGRDIIPQENFTDYEMNIIKQSIDTSKLEKYDVVKKKFKNFIL